MDEFNLGQELENINAEFLEERAAIQEESRAAEENKPRFEFIHNAEILENLKPVEWHINGILLKDSFYYDFGDPGHFKTFIALDRLLSIATGIDYHGHTVRQGTVFYIAGEGQQGIGRRIAAWHIAHGTKAKDVPFFLAKTPTQLMDPEALDEVRKAVDYMSAQYGPPAILHIDTLARNFGEGDENSTRDMNRVISNLDSAFGNNFCRGLSHHPGHTNKDRARGSIALEGAADEAFRMQKNPDETILTICTKMKDAVKPPPMLFEPGEVLLQIDNERCNSYVMELLAEGANALKGDKGAQKIEAVVTAIRVLGGYIESQSVFKDAVKMELGGNCSEATARRAIQDAVAKGKIIEIKPDGIGQKYTYKLP